MKELIGGDLLSACPADIAVRVQLVNILTDMLMEEQIEAAEIEECLDDWMEENFSVLADEESHREISEILVKVRRELTFCAVNDLDVPSGSMSLTMLREFNRRNQGNVS
jgi:hypothetical protein